MKLKIFAGAALALVLGFSGAGSASAAESTATQPTISVQDTEDTAILRFGQNLFLAGNNLIDSTTTNGIVFSAGNQLSLKSKSEYAFVAGNIIDFNATTEKDLFVAGNIINVNEDAKIGRDTFAAGNAVTVTADLPGNLAVTSNKLTLRDVKIDGNVDLAVEYVAFEGKVEITGKLSFNEDADVVGLSNATYHELEKYEVVEYNITSAEIWTARLLSIIGLFITIVVVMALFPATDKRVKKELTLVQFGKDLVIGLITLIGIPFITIFLLISFFAAPAGLVLLAIYLVMLYLSQGFAGLYLGKVIFEQFFKGKMNKFIEALVGIVIILLLSMLSPLVNVLATILGLGLIMQSIKPNRQKSNQKPSRQTPPDEGLIEEAEIAEAKPEDASVKDQNSTKTTAKKSPAAKKPEKEVKEED